MRTEVKLRFDSKDIPGGAQAVIEPAGCGPDVATVEAIEVLRQIVVWVTLDAADHRLLVLIQLLMQNGVDWLEIRRDRYTDEELDQARLLVMSTPYIADQVFGGPRLGTKYDLESACPRCGAGARQTSAMMVDEDARSELEGRRAGVTYFDDILVDERLAKDLESMGATGLSFRSVYAVLEDKRQVKLRWKQLCSARTLPPMSPKSTGILRGRRCASCNRSGYTTRQAEPPRLTYRAKDVAKVDDVNTTWEWFGDVKFDGDVSNALFPYPWFLVTPKVMRIIRAAGVKSFDWRPIHVIDE